MNPTELTKLKQLWQATLTETDRAFWRVQLLNPMATARDLRNLLREKLEIDLHHDSELYEFRQWQFARHSNALHEERITFELHHLQQEHPDWDPKRVHEELLKQICLQTAIAKKDTLALQAIRTVARYSALDLRREKFKESLRSKIEAGINLLHEEAKDNPTVRAAVNNLRDVLLNDKPHLNN